MGSMYGIFLHIFPTKKQLLYKFWSSLICSDLPSKLAKKQIFRYHKLYDIIYIIYYIIIYVYIIYIYIIYQSHWCSKKTCCFGEFPPTQSPTRKSTCHLGGGCAWVVKFRWENSSPRGYSPSLGHRHALGEIWVAFFGNRMVRTTDPWGCMVYLYTYMNGWIFYGKLVGKYM